MLAAKQCLNAPDTQTISSSESSETTENLRTLFDLMGELKTRPFELRTANESSQHATLYAFSPFGRETAVIGELGEFLTELLLIMMTSPSLTIDSNCERPQKSGTG